MTEHIPPCPICGCRGDAVQACPHCGTILAGYLRQHYRPWAVYNRALELASTGRLSSAAREAYAAVVLSPKQFELRLLLSRLLDATGEPDEAIAQAEMADELSPGNLEIESWLESLLARKYSAMSIGERGGVGP